MSEFTLKFSSKFIPSKKAVGRVEGREVYYKVRETMVRLVLKGKTKKDIQNYFATVTCNVKDKEIPALGQKQALIKMIDASFSDRDYRELRTQLWEYFAGHSKEAAYIMGQ